MALLFNTCTICTQMLCNEIEKVITDIQTNKMSCRVDTLLIALVEGNLQKHFKSLSKKLGIFLLRKLKTFFKNLKENKTFKKLKSSFANKMISFSDTV